VGALAGAESEEYCIDTGEKTDSKCCKGIAKATEKAVGALAGAESEK